MLYPVMNNTKWDELRLAMYSLTPQPRWCVLNLNGYRSQPDGEWFYHFRDGGFETIRYVDIHVETPTQRHIVLSALKKIRVPGERTPDGFRVFGYMETGQTADYF
jgi:hypothetical protein